MNNQIKLLLCSSVFMISACQNIQSFDGETGYQRLSGNPSQVMIAYTLDAKTDQAMTQQKLQQACAKELGLVPNSRVQVKIIDQQEIVNPKTVTTNKINTDVYLGNQEKTSFGLSSTPKLSNTSNTANLDMLNSKPNMLNQITAECLR